MIRKLTCPECGELARWAGPDDWARNDLTVPVAAVHAHGGDLLCNVVGPGDPVPADPVYPLALPSILPELAGIWLPGDFDGHTAGSLSVAVVRLALARGLRVASWVLADLDDHDRGARHPYLIEELVQHATDAVDYLNDLCAPGLRFVIEDGLRLIAE
jgi:hypothetical protein